MIEIKNLQKSYGSKEVLKGINLKLEEGKVYGIVGENGAGKTTFFRCLAGLETYNGAIKSDYKILKNHLGLLQTNPVFLTRMTAWEYLKLICIARNNKTEDFEQQNIFDLPLQQYAETYSTGMKKKLALLGILLQQNDIFILDEPFNGVDIHSNILISQILKELKAKNKTVLIASHIFSTLSDNCDQIHLLQEGVFVKSYLPSTFEQLNQEMKTFVVGDRMKRLRIVEGTGSK